MAPQEGLEPTTLRLTAECSAIELLRQRGELLHPIGIRRRPTLPGRVQPSTIGAEGLNFCVRYGNRWDPFAIVTGNCSIVWGLRSVRSLCFTHSFLLAQGNIFPLWEVFLFPEPLSAFRLPSAPAFRAAHPSGCAFRHIRSNACCALAPSAFASGLPAPAVTP